MDIMSLETTPAPYFLWFLEIGSNNIVDARTTEVGVTLATLSLETCNYIGKYILENYTTPLR
jgi:hypothetical protein